MRRSRAFLFLGWTVILLVVATASERSHAADRGELGPASAVAPAGSMESDDLDLKLLPLLARHDAPLFGSFIGPIAPPTVLPDDSACPPDMVEVEGDYCPYVEQRCLRWTDPSTKLQCEEFEKLPSSGHCFMATQHKHFCIDRYEWPNKIGSMPAVMASWNEAKASCEGAGKRLCTDTEWTLSCEGPERLPYPYGDGYARDSSACNIDKPYIWPNPSKVYDPDTQAAELARLDQREPSGSRSSCGSPYGVRDMVGNVDEWVVNASQSGKPHVSALKGGYWGPVRTRCRSVTTGHGPTFKYYQIGFRCCGEAHEVDATESPLAARL
jgi:sulfatase modifying factor 1